MKEETKKIVSEKMKGNKNAETWTIEKATALMKILMF